MVEFVARRARQVKLVKVYPYAAVTKGCAGRELAEIGLLKAAGAVAFTDGERAIANARVMRRALSLRRRLRRADRPAPGGADARRGRGDERGPGRLAPGPGRHPGRSPRSSWSSATSGSLELTGGRLHVAHVSTAAALEAIRQAKARGLRVTCDTAPHYLALNELEVEGYRTFAKVSPPLRSEDGPPRRGRGAARRHDRRHRQRPLPAGPGQQAAAVRPGGVRRDRARDHAAGGACTLAPRGPASACSTCCET